MLQGEKRISPTGGYPRDRNSFEIACRNERGDSPDPALRARAHSRQLVRRAIGTRQQLCGGGIVLNLFLGDVPLDLAANQH